MAMTAFGGVGGSETVDAVTAAAAESGGAASHLVEASRTLAAPATDLRRRIDAFLAPVRAA